MSRAIEWRQRAVKDLDRLSPEIRKRVLAAVNRLGEEGGDVRRLEGFKPPLYRLRIGDWRILFTYEESGVAKIQRILPRDKAYRG
jgi:mRNA-degrading endonuclease RelE of RelBE toxin-antitoxin system